MYFNTFCIVTPAVAFIALLLIAKMRDKHVLQDPYFSIQRWTLRDGYLVLIPTVALVYVVHLPVDISLYAAAGFGLATNTVVATATCVLYYFLIHKPYHVDKSLFGLDKLSFLRKGVLTANIAIPFSLIAFYDAGQIAPMQLPINARPVSEAAMMAASSLLGFCFVILLSEFVFRGVLYPPVARKIGRYGSIVVLSFIQSLMFVNPSSDATLLDTSFAALSNFLSSLVYYRLYIWTRSLYPPVIVKMALQWWSTKMTVFVALGSLVLRSSSKSAISLVMGVFHGQKVGDIPVDC